MDCCLRTYVGMQRAAAQFHHLHSSLIVGFKRIFDTIRHWKPQVEPARAMITSSLTAEKVTTKTEIITEQNYTHRHRVRKERHAADKTNKKHFFFQIRVCVEHSIPIVFGVLHT